MTTEPRMKVGKRVDVEFEKNVWTKMKCVRVNGGMYSFQAIDGSREFLNVDWMDYGDEYAMGRIKEPTTGASK